MRAADSNADGVLSKDEFLRAGMGDTADFARLDGNDDGVVTLDEMRAATEAKAREEAERQAEERRKLAAHGAKIAMLVALAAAEASATG